MTRVIFCNGTPILTKPTEAMAEAICAERHKRYPRNEYWHEPGKMTLAGFVPEGRKHEEVSHGHSDSC